MTDPTIPDDRLVARDVFWQGIHNARDLGGLPAGSGVTSFGRFFRASRLESLTAQGWAELVAAGVRTVIDLRNPAEVTPTVASGGSGRPAEVVTWFLPIEDQSDVEFMARWGMRLGSPVYYADNLQRWPDKLIAVFRVMVEAPAGGIVFHCSGGRDRTGLVATFLLSLAGVAPAVIADDYDLSVRATNDYLLSVNNPHETPRSPEQLAEWNATTRYQLLTLLAGLDPVDYLTNGGFSAADIFALRARLI